MRSRVSLLVAFAAIFAIGAPAQRRSNGGTLPSTGPISGTGGRATIDVRIVIENVGVPDHPLMAELAQHNTPITKLYSDSAGRVTLGNYGPGWYSVTISGEGVETATQTFELLPSETHHNVLMTVQPKSEAKANSPGGIVNQDELNVPGKARKEYDKGIERASKQDWAASEPHFRKATELYPKYSTAFAKLGLVLMEEQRFDDSAAALDHALQLFPMNASALRGSARLRIRLKRFDEAETFLRKSLQADPQSSEGLTLLAYCELQQSKFEMASQTAGRVHTGPVHDSPLSHLIAGKALEAQHKPSEAMEQYKMFLKEDPTSANAKAAEASLQHLQSTESAQK